MIPSLSPVTIGGAPAALRDYVALAERCGFAGIEIDLGSIRNAAAESSWDSVKALFAQYDVAPASAGLSVEWRKDEAAFEETLAALPALAEVAIKIDCPRICTWLPCSVNDDPAEFRSQSVRRFRKIADVLGDHGVRFGLEFVGPKTSRVGPRAMGANEFVWTIPQTLALIADIAARENNVGLLVDSYHWYCTGSSKEDLGALTPAQIVHVHINDAPDKPVDEQLDMERLLPGQGVIDLKTFLGTLAQVGYDGFVAVETFDKNLAALGREAAAEKAGAAMERLFGG